MTSRSIRRHVDFCFRVECESWWLSMEWMDRAPGTGTGTDDERETDRKETQNDRS